MNQGKIWLVVKPTVGLPLFLGGVTVIALSVHAAILTHTEWFPGYYSGKGKAKPVATLPATEGSSAPLAAVEAPTPLLASTTVAAATPQRPLSGKP